MDVPLSAAHFWYYAGWADKLEYAFPGRVAHPRRRRLVIPWNFPPDAQLKDRARRWRRRQHRRAQACPSTPLSALLFAEICRQAGPAARRRNIVPTRVHGALPWHIPGSTRSRSRAHGGRQADPVAGGARTRLTMELGGKAANIVFDDAPLDQAVEGSSTASTSTRGEVCCAGSACSSRSRSRTSLIEKAEGPPSRRSVGDPTRQEHRRRARSTTQAQLAKIKEPGAGRDRRGARRSISACDLPERG